MARFVIAVAVVLALGTSCGAVNKPDGGTIAVGGGFIGSGGGSAGGSSAGGSSAGGSAAGGSSAGGSAADAGCLSFNAVVATGNIPGSYNIGTGQNAGFEWWESVMGGTTSNGRVNFFVSQLWHQPAQMAATFPFTGSIAANTTFGNCAVCLQAALGCDMMGNNCQAEFLATGGSFNFTDGVRSPDAGVFAGSVTNVTYRHWNYMMDMPASANCFTVPTVSFRAVWPFTPPDGGVTTPDAGTDGGP